MELIETKFYFSSSYTENFDVLVNPPTVWETGFPQAGPLDLVADTGILTFYLDNSPSNSAGLAGLYSPESSNVLSGFEDGMPVKVTMSHGASTAVRFVGKIAAIRPMTGLFDNPVTEVEVHDFMSFLSVQEAGLLTIGYDKRVDEALTTLLASFPVQPEATNFDAGEEIFDRIFVGDTPKTTMAALFQKLAQNEMGRIYQQGDGTLRFENRHTRPENVTIAFVLDGIMTEFDVSYEQVDIFNAITTRILPVDIDDAATTILWRWVGANYPEIKPGETLVLNCPYTDPNTGVAISAIEINDPPVDKFGSVADGATDDMEVTVTIEIGANSAEVRLTNPDAFITGYLNLLQIKGKGIYTYDQVLYTAEAAGSVTIRGTRNKFVRLDLLTDLNKGKNFAHFILSKVGIPHQRSAIISFLANQSGALAAAAIDLELSNRFTAIESITGVSRDHYINRLRYRLVDGMVWCDILPAPEVYGTFLWDASHWDDESDAHWSI